MYYVCADTTCLALFGILAYLYGLYWSEQEKPLTSGRAILYCNNKKVLRQALSLNRPGIKDATADEYDIIMEIKRILSELTTKITLPGLKATMKEMMMTN